MHVTCLVDNTVQGSSRLWGEHGLAFLIETDAGPVLFDTGQSGTVLLHNLEVMGFAPASIIALALSHGHHDHTGGLPALLEHTRPELPLYAHSDLFHERFSKRQQEYRSIGTPLSAEAVAARASLRLSTEPQEIAPCVWTSGAIWPRSAPEGRSPSHLVQSDGQWLPDPYTDDMALVLEAPSGLVVLCGCCHAGLLNTLAHVRCAFDRPIVTIAGGIRLADADPGHLQLVSRTLVAMESIQRMYLNHCSGEMALTMLRFALGERIVHSCPAGTEFDLGSNS